MSQSQQQQQHPKPHGMWFSTKSTCESHRSTSVEKRYFRPDFLMCSENSSNHRVENMVMQVPRVLSPRYSDDIQVAAGKAAAATVAKAHCALPPPPPPTVPHKNGKPWTEKEHKLFLVGLKEYGKGDWKRISRLSVISKTPGQVASHAQKYFLRQSLPKKKRKSIHDVTLEESDCTVLSHRIDHHNLVSLPHNQCLEITPYVSNKALVPHHTDHQNWVAPSQNLDYNQALVPHHTDHQHRIAPSKNLDYDTSFEMTNHQNSIISPRNWDLASQNLTYRTDLELLQAQQSLPFLPPNNLPSPPLPPNNLPPQQMDDKQWNVFLSYVDLVIDMFNILLDASTPFSDDFIHVYVRNSEV